VSARDWPRLRHPWHGRHRGIPEIKETSVTSSLTASLPRAMPQPAVLVVPAGAGAIVQCNYCHAIGYSSDIPDIGRGPRCADTDACVKRWNCGEGRPVSLLPHGAGLPDLLPVAEPESQPEAPAELPPAQEAALGRLEDAWDEDPETRGEDEEPAAGDAPAPVAEAPVPHEDEGAGD
jgi:hypothetical protein